MTAWQSTRQSRVCSCAGKHSRHAHNETIFSHYPPQLPSASILSTFFWKLKLGSGAGCFCGFCCAPTRFTGDRLAVVQHMDHLSGLRVLEDDIVELATATICWRLDLHCTKALRAAYVEARNNHFRFALREVPSFNSITTATAPAMIGTERSQWRTKHIRDVAIGFHFLECLIEDRLRAAGMENAMRFRFARSRKISRYCVTSLDADGKRACDAPQAQAPSAAAPNAMTTA